MATIIDESKKQDICNKRIIKTSYGYNIPPKILVKDNMGTDIFVTYKKSSILALKPPLTYNEIIHKLQEQIRIGRRRLPYTYAIIKVDDILNYNIFEGVEYITQDGDCVVSHSEPKFNIDGKCTVINNMIPLPVREMIKGIIIRGLSEYIRVIEGVEYLIFFDTASSEIELFNKHISLVRYLYNFILTTCCQYININELDETNIQMLYFLFGSAGEFLMEVNYNRDETFNIILNYNLLSGSLMVNEHNIDFIKTFNIGIRQQNINMVLYDIRQQIYDNLTTKPKNMEIKYKEISFITPGMDKTNDVIKLMSEGYEFYIVPAGVDVYSQLYGIQTINGIKKLFRLLNMIYKKNEDIIRLVSEISGMLNNTTNDEVNIINKLGLLRNLLDKDSKNNNAIKVIDNTINYFRSLIIIYDPSNRITSDDIRRPRYGGKRTNRVKKKTRKTKRRNKKSKRRNKRSKRQTRKQKKNNK